MQEVRYTAADNAQVELILSHHSEKDEYPRLSLDKQTCQAHQLSIRPGTVGMDLVLEFSPIRVPFEAGFSPYNLHLSQLVKQEEAFAVCLAVGAGQNEVRKTQRYSVHANTPVAGRFAILPVPYFNLSIELNQQEYEQLVSELYHDTKLQCKIIGLESPK